MDGVTRLWTRMPAWGVAAGGWLLLMLVALGAPAPARADVIAAPTQFSALNSGGDTYAVVGDLVIEDGGSILCNDTGAPGASACAGVGAGAIKITVTGDLIMKAGSAILAENNTDGGTGADITITVGGDVTLCGPNSASAVCAPPSASAGAVISSSRTTAGGGQAGDITITVGNFPNTPGVGVFTMEPGSKVLANATVGSASRPGPRATRSRSPRSPATAGRGSSSRARGTSCPRTSSTPTVSTASW